MISTAATVESGAPASMKSATTAVTTALGERWLGGPANHNQQND
jgi:hypothetical protein